MLNINYKFAKEKMFNGEDHNHLQIQLQTTNQFKSNRSQPVALIAGVDISGSMGSSLNGKGYYIFKFNNHFNHHNIYGNSLDYSFDCNDFSIDTKHNLKSKLDYVKKATIDLLNSLNNNDYFGLIVFDDFAYPIIELQQVKNKHLLIRKIKQISLGGSTNIFDCLLKIEEQFNTIENKNIIKKAIILSDGQTNVGECRFDAFNSKSHYLFNEKNIQISTIGFGLDYNLELMSAIANKGEGYFYHLKESNEIFKIIENELNTINSITATNTELHIKIPIGFSFEENMNGYSEDYEDNLIKIKLGSIYNNKDIIFPIHLLKQLNNAEVNITITLKYNDIENNMVSISKDAMITLSNDKKEVFKENTDLIKELTKTIQRKTLREATIEYEKNNNYNNSYQILNSNINALTTSYNYCSVDAMETTLEFTSVMDSNRDDINNLRTLNSKLSSELKNN